MKIAVAAGMSAIMITRLREAIDGRRATAAKSAATVSNVVESESEVLNRVLPKRI